MFRKIYWLGRSISISIWSLTHYKIACIILMTCVSKYYKNSSMYILSICISCFVKFINFIKFDLIFLYLLTPIFHNYYKFQRNNWIICFIIYKYGNLRRKTSLIEDRYLEWVIGTRTSEFIEAITSLSWGC